MKAAFAFLTAIGGPATPTSRTFAWFPLVGAVIGGGLGLAWWGAGEIWPALLAAAIVVAADLAVTGLLHLDGLADSADGLLPPLSTAERRLEVMADPHTGAFGVAAVAMVLVLRVAALAAVVLPVPGLGVDSAPAGQILVLAAVWCGSRTVIAAVPSLVPYARSGGLAAAFLDGQGRGTSLVPVGLAAGAVAALAMGLAGGGARGVGAVVGVALGASVVVVLSRRRLGGFTGDVLGAACLTGETVGLLVLAIR